MKHFTSNSNSFFYSSSEWKEYNEYNRYRSKIYDYSIAEYENNKNEYNSIGITKNSYDCIKNDKHEEVFLMGDKDFFSLSKMKEILQIKKTNNYYDRVEKFFVELVQKKITLLFLLVLICGIIWNKKNRLFYLAQLVIAVGILTYLIIVGHLPERVYICVLLAGIFGIMIKLFQYNVLEKNRIIKMVIVLLSLFVVLSNFGYEVKSNIEYKDSNKSNSYIKHYLQKNTDKLFIIPKYEYDSIFYGNNIRDNVDYEVKNVIPAFDWTSYHLNYYSIMDKYRVNYRNSTLLSLYKGNDVFWITRDENSNEIPVAKKYIEDRLKKTVCVKKIKSLKYGYNVFSFTE